MIRSLGPLLRRLRSALRTDHVIGAICASMHATFAAGGAFAATPPSPFAIIEGLGDVAHAYTDGADTHVCLSDPITGKTSLWSAKTDRRTSAPKGFEPASQPAQWKEVGAHPLLPKKYWPPGSSRAEAVIFGNSVITVLADGNCATPLDIPMILTSPQKETAFYIIQPFPKPIHVSVPGECIYPPQIADFRFDSAFVGEVIPIDASSGLISIIIYPPVVPEKLTVRHRGCVYPMSYVLKIGPEFPPQGENFDGKFFLIPAAAFAFKSESTLKERSEAIDKAAEKAKPNHAAIEHVCASVDG